jgi:hypothetical protein
LNLAHIFLLPVNVYYIAYWFQASDWFWMSVAVAGAVINASVIVSILVRD